MHRPTDHRPPQPVAAPALDAGSPHFGGQEGMTVFSRVFVPRERFFKDGEWLSSGRLGVCFAVHHRQGGKWL